VSQENVEVVCKAIAEFDRAGIEAALVYFDPSVEWFGPPEWPEDRLYEGYDGLRKIVTVWTEGFDEFRLDVERAIDAGDHVVALLHQRGRIKGSNSQIEHRIGWDCEVRQGRVTRVRGYFSWEEAMTAAGLEA
jgi:ketosteroid isomerase-like protein